MFGKPTAEETGDGQRKATKNTGGKLAAGSLDFQTGFDIPRASSSNEKKTSERVK
jgi:hypothetical protein